MTEHYTIFRVAADYPVGGKPSYGLQPNMYYLSKEQAKLGNDVRVIARLHDSQPRSERDGDVEVVRLESPFNLNAYRMLRSSLGETRHRALIHTHSTSGLFLSAIKRPMGLPLFAHVHGSSRSAHMPVKMPIPLGEDYSESKMWYYYLRERSLWSSATRVLAVSECLKRDLIVSYGIPESKISVVYNGVDANLFHPIPGTDLPEQLKRLEGKRIILYVGHFGPRKGLIYLIQAMKEISKEVPDSVLVGIGGVPAWLGKVDYWGYLKKAISDLDIQDRVLLLDRVPNSELPKFYSRAGVFVLPSYYEAFAKVVLEAMSCARPSVITREGGPQEAIVDGKNGILIDYGSPKQLASAILRILQDESAARSMGRDARKRIESDFTWTAVAARVNKAYLEATKQ